MRPKVTVGICVKNSEATIKTAVDSIINQDFLHELIELIVVDGYSKDKTLSIIKESLSKENIKTRVFYENKGLGAARQIVVDNAEGDYILWVDSDLILPIEYVRRQVEFMDHNPAIGIAGGKYGMLRGAYLVATLENMLYTVNISKHVGKANTKVPGTAGSIFRVKAIRQVGGFDESIIGAGEDIDAGYRIMSAGWSTFITDNVFYTRCRETWKSHWNQYLWWGYGAHYVRHKHGSLFPLWQIIPLANSLTAFLRSSLAYKLTHRKAILLSPIECFFKMTAFCLGFARGHLDGYGHLYGQNARAHVLTVSTQK